MRGPVEDSHRVLGREIGPHQWDGLDVRSRRLHAVEEAGVELARLQLSDEGRLGKDVRAVASQRRQFWKVVTERHPRQRVFSQYSLGIGSGIGATEQKTLALNHVVPGEPLEGLSKLRIGVVAEYQWRRTKFVIGRDPVPIGGTFQRKVDCRRRADEDVSYLGPTRDLGR